MTGRQGNAPTCDPRVRRHRHRANFVDTGNRPNTAADHALVAADGGGGAGALGWPAVLLLLPLLFLRRNARAKARVSLR